MEIRAATDNSRPAGAPGAGEQPSGHRPAAGAGAEPADAAGRVLGWLTVLPALLVTSWLLAGLPLLLLGLFTPVLMLVVSVPVAVVLAAVGLRWIPGRWPGALAARQPDQPRTPWWTVLALVAVAVAFGVDQLIYHSQQIIVQRDPASYVQFGYWLAHHGSLPIPQNGAAFGGTQHLVSFYSPAFYQVGHAIVPQFMAGVPMILAGGFWIGGVGAAVAMAPLLGALGVLTFGGLAARLIGPRWAPLAALALALCLPEMFTSRSTYSEPAAQILFLGGLCLVIDSFGTDGIAARVIMALGGLALGLTVLARVDGISDLLPVIPYTGLLLIGRRRQALPLIIGVIAGAAYGGVDGVVLSRPYLAHNKGSLIPLAAAGAALLLITGAAVLVLFRRGLPEVRGKWLPNAAAALAVLVTIGFAIRPYVQTVRGQRTAADERAMASYQLADHLPVDPTRLYYEISLHWIYWYVGLPAVVLATLGAAVLARRCVRGRAPAWVLPLMAFAWIIVATLLRPSITPDQPWASRRLVPAVLPGFVLLAVWAAGWLVGWLRQRGVSRLTRGGLAALCAAALVLPAARTTFGLAHADGGPLGIRPVAVGMGVKAAYGGEIAAVAGVCAAIPANSAVLIVTGKTDGELAEVVRGMCGVPAAGLIHYRLGTVREVIRGIRRAGRRPVLLAGRRAPLVRFGGPVRQVMALRSTGDDRTLTTPPMNYPPFTINVWMSQPRR